MKNPFCFYLLTLKNIREIYYEKLFGYHNGKVAEWIDFFLDGIIEIANEAIEIVREITVLREKDMMKTAETRKAVCGKCGNDITKTICSTDSQCGFN